MAQKEEILNYFNILRKRSILGTSYLFIGEDSSLVTDIINLINCPEASGGCGVCWDCLRIKKEKHPDLLVIEPQGVSIRIDSIREAIKFLSLKSFRLKKKIVLVKGGQLLGPDAAGAFLKILEEPPKNSLIVICTSRLEGLLPTIISRCRKVYLPATVGAVREPPLQENLIQDFFSGQNPKFVDRKKFARFLWDLIVFLRNSLLYKMGADNNELPQAPEYEIILGLRDAAQIQDILAKTLKVYGAYNTVNMNLALNLIRMAL